MTSTPLSAELKAILAITAVFIGWLFAVMVPSRPSEENGHGVNRVPTAEIDTSFSSAQNGQRGILCLDGAGSLGILRGRTRIDRDFLWKTVVSDGSGKYRPGEKSEVGEKSNDLSVEMNGGRESDNASESSLLADVDERDRYGALWGLSSSSPKKESRLFADKSSRPPLAHLPNTEAFTDRGEMGQKPLSPAVDSLAELARTPNSSGSAPEVGGFSPEDLKGETDKVRANELWADELKVPEVEQPSFADSKHPKWDDKVPIAENVVSSPPSDLATEAKSEPLTGETVAKALASTNASSRNPEADTSILPGSELAEKTVKSDETDKNGENGSSKNVDAELADNQTKDDKTSSDDDLASQTVVAKAEAASPRPENSADSPAMKPLPDSNYGELVPITDERRMNYGVLIPKTSGALSESRSLVRPANHHEPADIEPVAGISATSVILPQNSNGMVSTSGFTVADASGEWRPYESKRIEILDEEGTVTPRQDRESAGRFTPSFNSVETHQVVSGETPATVSARYRLSKSASAALLELNKGKLGADGLFAAGTILILPAAGH